MKIPRLISMSIIFLLSVIVGWLTWPIIGFEEGPTPDTQHIIGRAVTSTMIPILITYLASAAYIMIKKQTMPNKVFLSILWVLWLLIIVNLTMGDYFHYIEKTRNAT
jgi:hypothetical protein